MEIMVVIDFLCGEVRWGDDDGDEDEEEEEDG